MPNAGLIEYYELGVGGGTVPYWSQFPNLGMQGKVVYKAKFEKLGPGIVEVAFFKLRDSLAVRAVSFGLEVTRPAARETVLKIGEICL